jgi:glycosyltransferase involved in cell wall biosynthesis
MKIWHPDTTCLCGGPKTFMKYFDKFFAGELVSSPDEADIIFGLNDWVKIDILKNRKCKYVHRANGVYRNILLNVPDWKERNERIKPHYLEADHVVFQSCFSMRSYFDYIGKTDSFDIIYNGVNIDEYNPKYIIPNYSDSDYESILLLGKNLTHYESKIKDIIGSHNRYIPKGLNKYNSFKELVPQLHTIKIAVDPDPQANCNNLDLELMALGIPVVCLAEGGNPELCLPELIASEDTIIDKIEHVLDNQKFYSKRARAHVVSKFNIKDCMEKYRRVFEQCII